jgi:hypothetical protein
MVWEPIKGKLKKKKRNKTKLLYRRTSERKTPRGGEGRFAETGEHVHNGSVVSLGCEKLQENVITLTMKTSHVTYVIMSLQPKRKLRL